MLMIKLAKGLCQALGLEVKELRCILVEDMRRYERRHIKNKAALTDQVPVLLLPAALMWPIADSPREHRLDYMVSGDGACLPSLLIDLRQADKLMHTFHA